MQVKEKVSLFSQLEASAGKLEQLMENDEQIIIITADLAESCKLKRIEKRFPDRFINVGIAEQNMVSIAAGLAHEGFKPFVHTFSVFSSLRACEQIRTDVFYNQANVKIIGTHCGMSGGQAGSTHFSLEDIGVIRAMPESIMITPADAVSAAKFIELLSGIKGPAYVRLDRNPLPNLYDESYEAVIGKGKVLTEGMDIAVIAIGEAVSEALSAGKELLKQGGPAVTVVDMATIKPMDCDLLRRLSENHSVFITVEEHNVYGGLGSAVGQAAAELGLGIRLKCIGIPDCYPQGNPIGCNRALYGLDKKSIKETVEKLYGVTGSRDRGINYESGVDE